MGFFTSYDRKYDANFKRKTITCKFKQLLNRFYKNNKKKLRHQKRHLNFPVAQPGFEPRLY